MEGESSSDLFLWRILLERLGFDVIEGLGLMVVRGFIDGELIRHECMSLRDAKN